MHINGELRPSPQLGAHSKTRRYTRRQYNMLERTHEMLRHIGIVATHENCNSALAHTLLDDLIRLARSGHTRFADIHVADIGLQTRLSEQLDSDGIHTIADLANSTPTKLMEKMDLMDATAAMAAALRRVLQLDSDRRAG